MKLKITIVPAKVLTDGTHRIRIGMSHNGTTRYFVTRFIVSDPKCVRGGMVGGIPNASYINQQLMKQMSEIYAAYDTLENTDYLSCSQLLKAIEDKIKGDRPISLMEVWERFVNFRKAHVSQGTLSIWKYSEIRLRRFFKDDFLMCNLTPNVVSDYLAFLKDSGSNATSRSIYFLPLRQMITFAVRQNLVTYAVSPIKGVEKPKANVRMVAITLEELRRLRDYPFKGPTALCRDIFMLSFYLCGMNIVDICRTDLSKQTVHFMRKKTESRRSAAEATEFTIQPEARTILDRIYRNGAICNPAPLDVKYIQSLFFSKEKEIKAACEIEGRFIYYSARKTFAQLANELMIKDSIIEYCLGDAISNRKHVIGSYIHVNRRMADKAIRKVFDAVASDKSIDELVDDVLGI